MNQRLLIKRGLILSNHFLFNANRSCSRNLLFNHYSSSIKVLPRKADSLKCIQLKFLSSTTSNAGSFESKFASGESKETFSNSSSSSTTTTSTDFSESEIRNKILLNALNHVEKYGFTIDAIEQGKILK